MKAVLGWLLALVCALSVGVYAINQHVIRESSDLIVNADKPLAPSSKELMLVVLGAGVNKAGEPTPMLAERLDRAGQIFQEQGRRGRVVLTGDDSEQAGKQVDVMARYLKERYNLTDVNLLLDPAGVNTRASIENLKGLTQNTRVVFISQEYHLPRTLYLAQALLDGAGNAGAGASVQEFLAVPADTQAFTGQAYRDGREVLARCKDFILLQFLRS